MITYAIVDLSLAHHVLFSGLGPKCPCICVKFFYRLLRLSHDGKCQTACEPRKCTIVCFCKKGGREVSNSNITFVSVFTRFPVLKEVDLIGCPVLTMNSRSL